MHQLHWSWVRSQHPSAQWNLRSGRWNSVEYSMKKNYKDTKTKCRLYWCLIEFYRLEIRSVMLVYSTQLCELLQLLPSVWLTFPTPSPFPKSRYIIYSQCVAGRGWGEGCWVVMETIFCRSLTLGFWLDSEPTKLLHHPKQKPRGEGAPDRQTPAAKSLYR